MELPHDIWDKIVKNSTGSIDEQVEKLDIEGLDSLIKKLTLKRNNMKKLEKSKFQFGDIVTIDKGEEGLFVVIGFTNNKVRIRYARPRTNEEGCTGFGLYDAMYRVDFVCAPIEPKKLTIFEKRVDILRKMSIDRTGHLVGDIIKYCTKTYHDGSNLFRSFDYESGRILSWNDKSVTVSCRGVRDITIPKSSIVLDYEN